ncbi:MAG: hypothetical protein NWF07_16590, partial [Candidatus Bathyarchaeota archaeon]|nr:hypothetical protein [Candidatus Bathyarchaeota archaeon]
FTKDDLNSRLIFAHAGTGLSHDRITHYPNLTWQHKALLALRDKYGLSIGPGDVLTRSDYQAFIRSHKYYF